MGRLGVSCVHCGEMAQFDELPDRPPPPMYAMVACDKCGEQTVVPQSMYEVQAGDTAAVVVEEGA